MDSTAIKAIQETQLAAVLNTAIIQMQGKGTDGLAIPNDYNIASLEKFSALRRRQRGKMTTPSLADFAHHLAAHISAEGSIVFAEEFGATAVLNFGTQDKPGHADDLTIFKPQYTAEYRALCQATEARQDQRSLCEFVEDWQPNLKIFADGEAMQPGQALASLRKLTIESIRSSETQVKQLAEQRSTLEQVSATSGKEGKLPTHFYFKCQPASHLPEREFVMRLSISTSDVKPSLRLHLVHGEKHTEEMRAENIAAIKQACQYANIKDVPIVSGSYSVGA